MDAYGHAKGVRLETEVTAMEERKESEKERWDRYRKQLQEAYSAYMHKMETDPEYRADTERFLRDLVTFGKDTD